MPELVGSNSIVRKIHELVFALRIYSKLLWPRSELKCVIDYTKPRVKLYMRTGWRLLHKTRILKCNSLEGKLSSREK